MKNIIKLTLLGLLNVIGVIVVTCTLVAFCAYLGYLIAGPYGGYFGAGVPGVLFLAYKIGEIRYSD
ncbi:hypothetical protein [Melghirimyces algeriensis]|uniref:Uncharacterized protein n=1 Tax=Melghirimyces algeriensis TaxID=910412 RepID=A0A521F7P7_9BACL|nr:hypothetical protein [Melghirimyces algeriensis]SMO92209.1 hypothetical protein SAMN06264849_11438 [Melghirimyces algeriensis]